MIHNLARYKPLKENILKFVWSFFSTATNLKEIKYLPLFWLTCSHLSNHTLKHLFRTLLIYLVFVVWKQKQLLILLSIASTKKKNVPFFKAIVISKLVLLIKINVTLKHFFMKMVILVWHKTLIFTTATLKYLLCSMHLEENHW